MNQPTEKDQAQQGLFTSATELSRSQQWFTARFGAPRLLSIGIHVALVGISLISWTAAPALRPTLHETAVRLYSPSDFVMPLQNVGRSGGGGGGGGNREKTPASKGELPPIADKQLAPPDPAPKNPDPTLIVTPTIVAPQIGRLAPPTLLNLGDPNGVIGPPSAGPGEKGGIGDGKNRGVGDRNGPGAGPGDKPGCCGEGPVPAGRDGVSAPTVVYRVEPQYSEEARKARYEGTVVLQAIIRKDGKVDVLNLVRSLGFGLDQNAIEALKQWRFRPATKDGQAVDSTINIEVRFNLR